MSSPASPVYPSRHAPPRTKRSASGRLPARSPSPFGPNNSLNMPPALSPKVEPNGKPVARRRTPANRPHAKPTNGSATADGVETPPAPASVLQDIQEQHNAAISTKENGGSTPNGHANVAEESVRSPTVAPPLPKATEKVEAVAKKIDWEIPRKAFHSSIAFGTIALYLVHCTMPPVIIALLGALALFSAGDFLRFRNKSFAVQYERILGPLMRESEKTQINASIWFAIGVLICLALYPMDVAVVSIIILSWADTAASTIGRLWGRYTSPLPRRIPYVGIRFAPRKSTAGFMAAFVTGGLIAAVFWAIQTPSNIPQSFSVPPIEAAKSWNWNQRVGGGWVGLGMLGMMAGIITAISESIDLGDLDDNLTLPVMAGAGVWAYLSLLRIIDTGLNSIPELR